MFKKVLWGIHDHAGPVILVLVTIAALLMFTKACSLSKAEEAVPKTVHVHVQVGDSFVCEEMEILSRGYKGGAARFRMSNGSVLEASSGNWVISHGSCQLSHTELP